MTTQPIRYLTSLTCLILSLCFTSCAPDTKTDEPVPDTFTYKVDFGLWSKRIGNLTHLDKWSEAASQVVGHSISPKQMLTILPYFDRVWNGENFDESASVRCLARMKSVPKQAVEQWNEALERIDKRPDPLFSAMLIIQLDPIFVEDRFSENGHQKMLFRLQSLPVDSVAEWDAALDDIGKPAAALTLISMDSLFTGDKFNAARARTRLTKVQSTSNTDPKR